MKRFSTKIGTLVFWYEGKTLFCKIEEMGADVYYCGHKAMPETKVQAMRLAETAWVW